MLCSMTIEEVESYLVSLEEPKQTTLRALRESILREAPGAEQGISYGMPAFRVDGKVIAGFAAFKHHLSYFPHSGSVLPEVTHDLTGLSTSRGALRFSIDEPLPEKLVQELIAIRIRQVFGDDTRGHANNTA